MTAARKPAAKKPAPPAGAVSVVDLPDNKAAQISEAMEESVPFVMGDGDTYTFKPLAEWSYKANLAFARGDVVTWLRSALVDKEQVDAFLERPSREVGRVVRYYDDRMGATRGEGSSSSTS